MPNLLPILFPNTAFEWGSQHDIFEGMIKQLYYDKQRHNMPTIKPKRPIAEPKISTIKIFTNKIEFAASARAAPEPTTPTETPQNKLTKPTAKPAPNIT
uniref:Uncharacterized protein n=1 Tax=Glossina palpalis gambiensis TaxID=67801 RepID=A0A1B0BL69_9MUSC